MLVDLCWPRLCDLPLNVTIKRKLARPGVLPIQTLYTPASSSDVMLVVTLQDTLYSTPVVQQSVVNTSLSTAFPSSLAFLTRPWYLYSNWSGVG